MQNLSAFKFTYFFIYWCANVVLYFVGIQMYYFILQVCKWIILFCWYANGLFYFVGMQMDKTSEFDLTRFDSSFNRFGNKLNKTGFSLSGESFI